MVPGTKVMARCEDGDAGGSSRPAEPGVADYGPPRSLRITIGRDMEMRAVVQALAEFTG